MTKSGEPLVVLLAEEVGWGIVWIHCMTYTAVSFGMLRRVVSVITDNMMPAAKRGEVHDFHFG